MNLGNLTDCCHMPNPRFRCRVFKSAWLCSCGIESYVILLAGGFSWSSVYWNDKKVQVGKDQEKAQSEKDSHSKNRGGKKLNQQSG